MDETYERKNFKEGSVLKASDMRDIEDAIKRTEDAINTMETSRLEDVDALSESELDEMFTRVEQEIEEP